MTNLRFVPRAALLAGALIAIALPTIAEPVDWHEGDLFVAVGGGAYHVFDRDGRFKQALDSELGGYTTDCGFHPVADGFLGPTLGHGL